MKAGLGEGGGEGREGKARDWEIAGTGIGESLWKFFPFPGVGPVTRVSPISVHRFTPRFYRPLHFVQLVTDILERIIDYIFRDRVNVYLFSNEWKRTK